MKTELSSHPVSAIHDPMLDLVDAGRHREFKRRADLLRSATPSRKAKAAASLVEFGSEAVEPLCRALGDPDDKVKSAASKALAEIGDPRAVPLLMEALKRNLVGGSGRRHALLTWAPLTLALISIATGLVLRLGGQFRAAVYVTAACGILKLMMQSALILRDHAHFHRAAVEALAEIAERDPVPELREALPDLRALAKSGHGDRDLRRAISAAVIKIDRLTAEVHTLPIAAAPPESTFAQLPRADANHAPYSQALPRPADEDRT